MFKKIFHSFVLLAFLTGLLAATPVLPAHAATLTVNTLVDENDGSCVDGDCSLRDALQVAVSGDTIDFSVTGTIVLTSKLIITQPVTIAGPGADLLTVSGNDLYTVFWIDGGSIAVSISGLKISNGYYLYNGAGIYSVATLLTLDHVILSDNRTDTLYARGGGLFTQYGVVTITNSLINSNHADQGSGIFCYECNLSITDTAISGNDDVDAYQVDTAGGGLFVFNTPDVTLTRVTLSGNTAGSGGGIYIASSTVSIVDSAILDNTVDTSEGGGGVYVYNPLGEVVTMNNVTVSGNHSTDGSGVGGGILNPGGALNLNNVTIADNISDGGLGGGGIVSYGTTNLSNTIIANNVATASVNADCRGTLNSLDYNLIENVSLDCTVNGTTTNTITGQDPKLDSLALVDGAYLHTLQSDSPAIDTGDDGTCEAADQRGMARPVGPHCDMGAHEYESSNPIVFNTNDSGPSSLRFAVDHLPFGGGTIFFDPSLAGQTILLASRIDIAEDTAINGLALDPYVILSGGGGEQIFGVNNGVTLSLRGMDLSDGYAGGGGGDLGGAILNYGNLIVDKVNFSNNTAEGFGGAIYNSGGASLFVQTSTFTLNTAADANNITLNGGGAIASFSGSVIVRTSDFDGNTTDGNGGAIYLDGGINLLETSTFRNNTASDVAGGGVYSNSSTLTIQNVTFVSNNASAGIGGGLFNDSTALIYNSTFSDNAAFGGGGAVASDASLYLYNSILANSVGSADDCFNDGGTVDANVRNLIEVSSCGAASLSSDPLLGPLADNGGPTMTMEPMYNSPVINAGDAATCLLYDQRGIARPSEAACEIGAFEVPDSVVPFVVSIVRANPDPTALAFVDYTVTFSEDVTGVDASDFSLQQTGVSGASITSVGGSLDTYTVTVDTGIGNGTLRLDLMDDNSITDGYGLPLGGLAAGDGDFSGETYTVSKTAPVQLVPANGEILNTRRPFFDWTDFAGAKGYQIQVSKSAGFGTTLINVTLSGATNSQYTATKDLPANTTLYWRVRAKLSSFKYSVWSSPFSFTTGNPPSVPGLLSPSNGQLLTNLTPTLDWADSTVPSGVSLDHYQLQVDDSSDFSSPVIDTITVVSEYVTGTLDTNTKYFWRVRAWGSNGHSSGWSVVRNFREAMLAPTLLSPISAATVPSLKPLFDWSDVVGATGYTIQVSLNSNFSSTAINATIKTPTSQYVHSINLLSGKLYYWRVRANGANGPSLWSAVETFMTP